MCRCGTARRPCPVRCGTASRGGNAGSNTFTDHREVLAAALRQVPAGAWKPGTAQDGTAEDDKDVAEVTGLMSRAGN